MNRKTEGLTSWIFLFFPVWADGFSFYTLPELSYNNNCRLLRNYYVLGSVPGHSNLRLFFFFLFSFCLNLDRKMRKNLDRKMLWKSQALNYASTLLFTVSTFETAVDVQMKVAMWSGKCGGIHLWRLCISPALEPTEKEIVVHSIKYCQYD